MMQVETIAGDAATTYARPLVFGKSRRGLAFAAGIIAIALGCTAWAQTAEEAPAGPGHEFGPANVTGTWLTLRNEMVDFQAGGTFTYTKANEEPRKGDWVVSNGILWLTFTEASGSRVMAMKVTAFGSESIRLEGLGGKSKSVFVKSIPAVTPAADTTTAGLPGKAALTPRITPASTPHLDNHGGPVVNNPSAHVMYWAGNWDSKHADPQFKRGNFDAWFKSLLKSDYFDKSGQYGAHSGDLGESNENFVLFPDPGGSTNSLFIHTWATGMIETPGTGVPYPCSNNDLYAVMLPKGTTIDNGFNKTCGSFGAYHLFAPVVVPPFVCGLTDLGGARVVPYTIIPVDCASKSTGPNGFYNDFDSLTMLVSHETVEAMTDPIDSFATGIPVIGGIVGDILGLFNVSPSWYDNSAASLFTDSESADICEKRGPEEVWLNNSLVAAYWSNSDNDCAAGPGVVRSFSLKQTGVPGGIPVPVTFDTRVPDVNVGSGFTINVATNTVHSYSYPSVVSGGPGARYTTTQPPASVTVTDTFTLTAPYTTQYFLTVKTNPAAAATGNVSLTPSNWYNKGPFTIHSDQTVNTTPTTRYNFLSWTGDISATTHDFAFTLDAPKTATANYGLQHLVNFNETGIPAGPPWHVTVEGVQHLGPFPDWTNAGDTLHYTYEAVVPALTKGTCYALTGVSPASPLVVNAPVNVTGTYITQTTPQAIMNYKLVSVQPAAGKQSYVTYRADVANCGPAQGSVTATADTLDPFTIRIVPGQGTLSFAPVPANSQVTSSGTFTILTDTSIPFDPSKLRWTFGTVAPAPVANPGPNQTVTVGSTVVLDGSGSTNPSGTGSLSYSWVITSRPPGSSPRLVFATTPAAQFVADAPGIYVLSLTVSNGAMSSTASVTITATP